MSIDTATAALRAHFKNPVNRFENMKPGAASKMLASLPPDERQHVIAVANFYDVHKEAGRHGNLKALEADFGLDPALAEKFHEGLVLDEICARLAPQTDQPLPDVNRRDVIEAAFDGAQNG